MAMTEHHQRRLLSNKSSISNNNNNNNSNNAGNGSTLTNRYLNNSNSNRWLLQQQQYPNITATSSLNTQIYNNRAHSLQQLQIRDPYGSIIGYSQQQQQQQIPQQQTHIPIQDQGQPVYMDPYSYMYSTPAVVIPLTHQRQLNPMINHHQLNNQLQQRVPQQYMRGTNNNNNNNNNSNNNNSNGRRRNNNNNNVNGRRKSTTQRQSTITDNNSSTNNKHLRNVKDANDSEQANEMTLKLTHLQNYCDIVFDSINDNHLNEYKELLENISNDNTAKVKTIINKIPKKPQQQQQQQHSANKIVYKLKVPILTASNITNSENNSLFIDTITNTYKNRNNFRQPLNIGGSTSFKVSSIKDFSPKLLETFLNSKGKQSVSSDTAKSKPATNGLSAISGATTTTSTSSATSTTSTRPRQLQLKANVSALYNESFDLSFDGKAMDRSDIFRMVDSFSVAFSDNDDSMQNTQSIIIQDSKDKKNRKINNHKKLNHNSIMRTNKDDIDIDEDTENNIESTKNESQINESNNDLADAGSSSIIDNNESSFIVNPSDKILPAEISSINTAY
ncbi:hypothetical protein C6P45_003542 [Maudiozyma exigua]|uniref:Uncharacterized protein n=1 Tax=Maudiozyma exigua TaxID=34358 RepID=A0A9P6VTZ7_MAUEX|nr:hypothetical protein C6P45_003542 [Kazachstania exigua]